MDRIICTLNCGSSSVKYNGYNWEKEEVLAVGIVERVTIGGAFCQHQVPGREKVRIDHECPNHKEAIKLVMETLVHPEYGVLKDLSSIQAVGHRVLHGGDVYTKSVIITPEVLQKFRDLSDLGPLHNPANVLGIEGAQEVLPDVPHMAVMDTAWHQTMPDHAFMYALPYEWYEKYSIRRYGFHGTSFLYVAKRAAVLLGKDPFKTNAIICHIGNGASIDAVKNGLSYDTSMGLTPLEGLVMGTRAGDHDAAIDVFMMKKEGYTADDMNMILNKKSGVLGVTGKYADRRDIEIAAKDGDARAKLALELECYRLKKYIGAYFAALGGADALIFTAGVGEMSSLIRSKVLEGLECMGIRYDKHKNDLSHTRNAETDISAEDSAVKILIIPTDEERVFLEDVVALLEGRYDVHTNYTYSFQSPDYRNYLRDTAFEAECEKHPGLRAIAARVP